MAQHSKSSSQTFRSAPSAYLVHLFPAPVMGVAATVGEEGESCVLIHVHVHVLGRALGHARVLGPNHGLGPHDTIGGATLTSPRGMVRTAEEAEEGLESVGEVAGEADVAGIVEPLGLVLHLAGVVDPLADDRQVTNVADMEGAERGRPRILCVLAAHGQDLTLVPAPHALGRGRAPCLTLPTRDTVGAGAGVARDLGL